MTERVPPAADRTSQADERDGVATIEVYATDDGVVFYDAENPLAWVEATVACALEDLR